MTTAWIVFWGTNRSHHRSRARGKIPSPQSSAARGCRAADALGTTADGTSAYRSWSHRFDGLGADPQAYVFGARSGPYGFRETGCASDPAEQQRRRFGFGLGASQPPLRRPSCAGSSLASWTASHLRKTITTVDRTHLSNFGGPLLERRGGTSRAFCCPIGARSGRDRKSSPQSLPPEGQSTTGILDNLSFDRESERPSQFTI
jgi:hypothetical protein